jgi:hypothetical protein
MRVMSLPRVPPRPSSIDDCIAMYSYRLQQDVTPHPEIAASLMGYMGWPKDQTKRRQWMATAISQLEGPQLVRAIQLAPTSGSAAFRSFGGLGAVTSAAFTALSGELVQESAQWSRAADILQMLVDLSHDDRAELRGGPSISKAVDLLELAKKTPGHARFRHAWAKFRDVAHLVAASAFITSKAQDTGAAEAGVIMKVILLAPDAVLALAAGYQFFGLRHKSHGQQTSVLPSATIWRLPSYLMANPLLPFRRLTKDQLEFLKSRRMKG